jgi:hypothetical protein
MIKYLLGLAIIVCAGSANAADFNGGKKWGEMTDAEKKVSMDRLKALNVVSEAKVLREAGFVNVKQYNRVWNPTVDQTFDDAYNSWKKMFPVRSPYKHNAWLGER